MKALQDIGFSDSELDGLLRALSGVLALTLLEWEGKDGDEGNRYAEPKDQAIVAKAAGCLQVEAEALVLAFSTRKTYLMTGEMYVKQLDETQAADAADALAKAVYGRMFDAVVARINDLLSAESDSRRSVQARRAARTARQRPSASQATAAGSAPAPRARCGMRALSAAL